jgi:hypothetical protein
MILVADFMWKYVPTKELYKKFMIEGKKWDNDFTMQCFYEKDILFTFLKYAKEK